MAKKKNSMALFEVVGREGKGRGQPALSIPEWMRGQQTGDPKPDQPAASDSQAAPEAPEVPEAVAETAPEEPRQSLAERQGPRVEPIVSTVGGRLTVSLNYVSCTVTLLAILLLVIVAFMMGRASARPQQTPTEPAAVKADTAGGGGGGADVRAPRRSPDKYYLVIQDMGGMTAALKADAEAIVEHLKFFKVLATVEKMGGNSIVWSLKGFDSPDSAEAIKYVDDINDLGRRYRASRSGKPYVFNERYSDGRPKFSDGK